MAFQWDRSVAPRRVLRGGEAAACRAAALRALTAIARVTECTVTHATRYNISLKDMFHECREKRRFTKYLLQAPARSLYGRSKIENQEEE
ncbi:hypothetical protein EVAR_18494_1 [Eumeta japonica]|uniref:Uncharacterized protein n=1 Tax=Eumeta variegata TaxID=151549 RepID=A0A4C1UZR4_EUMVA|nr:hypothetical protein EVAR_18494_1 [Eumeta japonica]